MIDTHVLRRQHDDALAMAQRLLELVDRYRPGATAYPILMQLNRLYSILRVHLAQEDILLYPALRSSPDPRVVRTARSCAEEMGGLASELECFARHWSSTASIVARFDEFREAANELMLALAVRIERENRQLYPLLEEGARERRDAA